MSSRGWLAVSGATMVAGAWIVVGFFGGRAWQIGGLGALPFTVGYAGLLLGLGVLVFALPRRARAGAGLALLAALALFLALWPSWEGRVFPYEVSLDQLLAALDPGKSGRVKLYVYTTRGAGWVTGALDARGELPAAGKIVGFYAERVSLPARLEWVLSGFTLRPVWPGDVHRSGAGAQKLSGGLEHSGQRYAHPAGTRNMP